jgi:hypothetical protein
MEVVLHSWGKPEELSIQGEDITFIPGVPTVVPDKIGERLLEKSNYLTVDEYETWLEAREEKAERERAELAAKTKKRSTKKEAKK